MIPPGSLCQKRSSAHADAFVATGAMRDGGHRRRPGAGRLGLQGVGGGTDTGRDAVADAATDPEIGLADDGEPFPDVGPDDLPVDAAPEAIAEVLADAGDLDVTSPQGCDPLPAAGTLWALSAPDRETAAQVPMCTWRGDVVLIVNTAAS